MVRSIPPLSLTSSAICSLVGTYSGYVRKSYDVKNRAFLQNLMRDFGHFYAQFLLVNHSKYIRCENRAFSMKNMRVFSNLMC